MIRAMLLCVLLCGSAVAQERAIVSISVPMSNGSTAMGTGCVVVVTDQLCSEPAFSTWRKARILTAAHVVEGSSSATVKLSTGEITNARVYRRAVAGDAAVLDAFIPPGIDPIPVGDAIEPGSMVIGYGLGAIGTKWPDEAEVRRLPAVYRGIEKAFILSGGQTTERNTMLFDVGARQGDSGGPIICNGKVIGVISGGITDFRDSQTWPLLSAHTNVLREVVR